MNVADALNLFVCIYSIVEGSKRENFSKFRGKRKYDLVGEYNMCENVQLSSYF